MVDNKKGQGKTKRKGRKDWVKGMPSPNPAGAPKRGHSWSELIKTVGDMTGPEAALRSLEMSKQLVELGDGITLKEAVVLRAYGALIFDPMPSLLTALMDRAEGKPSQPITVDWRAEAIRAGVDPDVLVEAVRERLAAGTSEDSNVE